MTSMVMIPSSVVFIYFPKPRVTFVEECDDDKKFTNYIHYSTILSDSGDWCNLIGAKQSLHFLFIAA